MLSASHTNAARASSALGDDQLIGGTKRAAATPTSKPMAFLSRRYGAMTKAAGIVKDYVYDFYSPIHQLSWRDTVRCLPLLLLLEYMVYQADAVAENSKDIDLARVKNRDFEKLTAHKERFIKLLKRLDFYDRLIEHELDMGEQFLRLENKLTSGHPIERADVMRTAELRSSDVRLLHCLMFRLLKRPYDEGLLSLLWPVEVIADIGNDFNHYADDVAKGSYNTYSMFVKLYGERAPEQMQLELQKYEKLFLERLDLYPTSRKDKLLDLCTRFYRTHTMTIPAPIIGAC